MENELKLSVIERKKLRETFENDIHLRHYLGNFPFFNWVCINNNLVNFPNDKVWISLYGVTVFVAKKYDDMWHVREVYI